MRPHPMLVERQYHERIDRLMAEANQLRLLREARAGRPQTAPNRVGIRRALGGLHAMLAAMTRLRSVAAR